MAFSKRAALLAGAGCLVAFALIVHGAFDHALAQGAPFGARTPNTPPVGGFAGWILSKQAEFYRALSASLRAAKADGSAPWLLFGLSFVYGIFHAAGPGHGKAVISSYIVANDETWTRGVILSFASAVMQALVAILIVGIAAGLLNATAQRMNAAVRYIEIASYLLIALIGARLIFVKGRGFLSALRKMRGAPDAGAGHCGHDHAHHHAHEEGHAHREHACRAHGHHHEHAQHRHDHAHDHHGHDHHHHDHDHDHDHDHASAWGHAHGPEPKDLAGPGGWRRGLSAIVAVGLRPCSGAIIVLVFALSQGLFWA
ncbi:MAG: nickel/cobalt transporter, partial [Pseudorhodoplanes sp.]